MVSAGPRCNSSGNLRKLEEEKEILGPFSRHLPPALATLPLPPSEFPKFLSDPLVGLSEMQAAALLPASVGLWPPGWIKSWPLRASQPSELHQGC